MISFPSLFKIPDDAKEIVPRLFSIFRRDFIDNTTYFLSSPVVIPRPHENEVYPDTFWHIVSKQEVKGSQNFNTRLLDYERAKRIVWLKPLIEQFREPEVLKWRQVEFDKISGKELMKYYLWYKDGQYMTVLKAIEKNTLLQQLFMFSRTESLTLKRCTAKEKNSVGHKKRASIVTRPLNSFYTW